MFAEMDELMMMKRKFAGWACAVLAGVAALNVMAEEVSSPVLARLSNGETITEKDVSQYLDRRVDLRAASRNAWGLENVVQEMALTRALNLEGQAMGEVRRGDGKAERFDDVYGYGIFKKLAPVCEQPADEAATRRFYEQNPKAFSVPTTARLSRIMLPRSEKVDGEPAVGWLLAQIQAIGAGATTFGAVAEKAEKFYRLDPQGDLGWVSLGGDTSIMGALADAKPGDIVGPVPEGEFIYIFQVNAKRDGRVLRWDEASSMAAKRAVSYCQEQGQVQVRERMFQKYGVTVDKPAISNLFKVTKTGG